MEENLLSQGGKLMCEGQEGGGGKSRNIMINNIGGGWERNENSMFKSRKMSKNVDGFILK